ncbi:hypothetical protein Tco_0704614 [Tanacetum coccineum]|uniref:Reverse transcriptase domain-containing protein n=1 Tax=Tanacetum coccineum TaxID=301880 RepID=A0ABQ4Y2A3_9ASTR
MAPNRRSGPSSSDDNENPDVATVIAQQLQAIITQVANNANNANNGNNGGGNGNEGNNGCSYKTFQSCNPKEYDGKGGAITLTRWIEKMENVIDNSGCAENQKVRYAASSLVNKALTWWNTQCQARGRVAALAMSWNDFSYVSRFLDSGVCCNGFLTGCCNRLVHIMLGFSSTNRHNHWLSSPRIHAIDTM